MSISLYTWHASEKADLKKWVNDAMEFVIKNLKILPKDKKKFLHAMALRSSLFTMDHYEISSRLAHGLLFHNSQPSNAIIYPSIVEKNRCCFAISPDFTYKHMRLARAYRMEFSHGWIFRSLARGRPLDSDENILEWKETGEYEIDEEERKYLAGNYS